VLFLLHTIWLLLLHTYFCMSGGLARHLVPRPAIGRGAQLPRVHYTVVLGTRSFFVPAPYLSLPSSLTSSSLLMQNNKYKRVLNNRQFSQNHLATILYLFRQKKKASKLCYLMYCLVSVHFTWMLLYEYVWVIWMSIVNSVVFFSLNYSLSGYRLVN
jgi:hypothetical protein